MKNVFFSLLNSEALRDDTDAPSCVRSGADVAGPRLAPAVEGDGPERRELRSEGLEEMKKDIKND